MNGQWMHVGRIKYTIYQNITKQHKTVEYPRSLSALKQPKKAITFYPKAVFLIIYMYLQKK